MTAGRVACLTSMARRVPKSLDGSFPSIQPAVSSFEGLAPVCAVRVIVCKTGFHADSPILHFERLSRATILAVRMFGGNREDA